MECNICCIDLKSEDAHQCIQKCNYFYCPSCFIEVASKFKKKCAYCQGILTNKLIDDIYIIILSIYQIIGNNLINFTQTIKHGPKVLYTIGEIVSLIVILPISLPILAILGVVFLVVIISDHFLKVLSTIGVIIGLYNLNGLSLSISCYSLLITIVFGIAYYNHRRNLAQENKKKNKKKYIKKKKKNSSTKNLLKKIKY